MLSACWNNNQVQEKENVVSIVIENNSDIEFSSMVIKLYQEGDLTSSQGTANADGSNFEKDDVLRLKYYEQDMNLEGIASMEVFLVDSNGSETSVNQTHSLVLTKNKEFNFEITGDTKDNAKISKIN
ncbi:hypothetical protein BSG1_05030 [Bacillus sp. SG-1]|nr:hypothetical protein BSG1_05030 [Bacillus sp. SG-1]